MRKWQRGGASLESFDGGRGDRLPRQRNCMFKILSVSRRTRLLIERNDTLALYGFRVISPRTPEEAPLLAVQQNVDAVVIGHSVEGPKRQALIQQIRRRRPDCMVLFVYAQPNGPDEALADTQIDVTDGPEALVRELRSRLVLVRPASGALVQQFLDAAIAASGADFGNVQWFNPATQALRIIAQRGFGQEFLRFFAVVHGNGSCGSAAQARSRIVVEDVRSDDIFRGNESGEMLLRANVLAVQSTPLIGPSGQLAGVVSTHYRRPGPLPAAALRDLDNIVEDYLERIERAA